MCVTKSPIPKAFQEKAKGLHKAGVSDQVKLREFDSARLLAVEPLEPAQSKHICESSRVSQAVFVRLLNTASQQCRSGAKEAGRHRL